jgi:hypothetical protein
MAAIKNALPHRRRHGIGLNFELDGIRKDEAAMARKPMDTVGLTLRLRESLRAALEKSADQRGMSLNAEVISRLEYAFDDRRSIEVATATSELVSPVILALSNLQGEMLDLVGHVQPAGPREKLLKLARELGPLTMQLYEAQNRLLPTSKPEGRP